MESELEITPVEFRRHLHAHPELSFREHDTAAFIETQLDRLGIGHRRIAQTGVLATIRGTKTPEQRGLNRSKKAESRRSPSGDFARWRSSPSTSTRDFNRLMAVIFLFFDGGRKPPNKGG